MAGSNLAGVVARSEDELLWLTVRLLEAARQMDASAEFCIGLAQPFGDYLSRHEHTHSPLAFADTLLRTSYRATLNALELELVMGVSPRGSYCRNSLEVSRLIDMYTCLGVPLQVTMSYPSAHRPDALADSDLSTPAGHWHDGLTRASQADWAEQFATLALCAPAVHAVMWSHFDDALPHQFPHGGLVDSQGTSSRHWSDCGHCGRSISNKRFQEQEGFMNATQILTSGTLKPDGTLELNEKPARSTPGPVQVLMRSAQDGRGL